MEEGPDWPVATVRRVASWVASAARPSRRCPVPPRPTVPLAGAGRKPGDQGGRQDLKSRARDIPDGHQQPLVRGLAQRPQGFPVTRMPYENCRES
jgi:hypothetical protein